MFVEKILLFGYNDDNMIPNTEGIWEKCYNQSLGTSISGLAHLQWLCRRYLEEWAVTHSRREYIIKREEMI